MGWSVGQLGNLSVGRSILKFVGHSVGRCVDRFFSQSCRRSVVQALGIWLVDWWVG